MISATHQFKEENRTLNFTRINQHLTKVLKEHGYSYSEKQVKTKMETLRKKYKEVLDHNARHTGNDRKEWDHFDVSIQCKTLKLFFNLHAYKLFIYLKIKDMILQKSKLYHCRSF